MPFFLDGSPTQGEISEAINYLLSNFSENVSSDQSTGQIIGPGGEIVGYLYKYMFIKYADSFDGSVGFSNTPTNKGYYGLRNADSSTESTNPVDYIWTQVTGGFGTTKFLYYLTTGGRQIQFQVATAVPNAGWIIDPGTAIDLDVTSATNAVANFVVIRVPNNSSAPTDAECVSAIGRTPINGDLCTINYNSGLASIQYKYTTGWAVFQKYITADIVEAQTLSAFTANLGTVTAGDLSIGSSPALSGTNMTGSGAHIYSSGNFVFGNSSKSMVFDGFNVYFNGMGTSALASGSNVLMSTTPGVQGDVNNGWIGSFTVSKDGYVSVTISGFIYVSSNTTSYPGLYGAVVPAIYRYTGSGSGTLIANETQYILVTAPVFQPAFGSAVNRYQNVYVWTRNVFLTAGTYSGFLNSSFNFKDTSGVNQYAPPASDRLFSGYINSLQPAV
jgi:hypothetical protein